MRIIIFFLFVFLTFSGHSQSFYKFEHLTVDNGLSSNTVTCAVQDKHGFLWFGTFNGLNRYDGYSFKVYKTSLQDTTNISNNRIVKAIKDNNGDIWFLTFDEIYNKYDYSTDKFTRYNKEDLSEEIIKLFSNSQLSININQNVVWKRVRSSGVQRQDLTTGETQAFYNDPFDNNSLSDNNVNFLYLDNSEILWIGTQGKGINKLDINQKQFHNYAHNPANENSLQDSYIREIAKDKLGNLWVGTHNSGLCKIERSSNTFTRITTEDGLYNNRIRDIFVDSEGNIWVGFSAQDAVQKIDPIENTIITYQHDINDSVSYNSQSTYSICEDEFGFIWFGGFGGVSRYNPATGNFKSFSKHGNEPLLSFSNVRVIFQDKSKNIWIGTEGGGLNKMIREYAGSDVEKISFEHFKNIAGDTNSLSNNWIYSISEDDNGMLWIGTGFGLNRFDPNEKKFTVITEESGLPDDMIYGILIDNNNNLWLSHSKGLTHFETSTNKTIRNYNKSDGLQGNQFSEDAYYKSQNGEMFFGGSEGLTSFYPDSIQLNQITPKIVFTSLSILNDDVKIGKKILGRTVLNKSIFNTERIELDHKHRTFSVEFAALHYSSPLENKYVYMLEGFDDEWNFVDATKRSVSYSNLRGGDYTLLVKASNNDNNWAEEPIALQIHINLPLWKTWYAILLYVIILSAVITFIIRERGKKSNRDKLTLEQKIDEVQQEVDKQKEEIVLQKQELKLRATEEKDMRWYNEGLAKFSEIISKNKGNVNKLSRALISELVNYLGADQGGVFIINDNNAEDVYFELTGSFAYDGQKLKAGRVELQEGQIGACYKEKKIIQINNLPETYTTIRSGLGKKSPRFLILVPLKIDDDVLGVLEITSFIRVKGVRIVFLEKLSENISSVLATERATEKMQVLFKKSKEQADVLAKKEEEMRLTLEEVQAANEKAKMREKELTKKIEENEATIAELQNKANNQS